MHVYHIRLDWGSEFITRNKELATDLLTLTKVKRKTFGGKELYVPEDNYDINLSIIDPTMVRTPTEEQVENQELIDAKSMKDYYRTQSEKLTKEVSELKCKIKVLIEDKGGQDAE